MATVPFYNNNKATLIVHPHLEAFRTGRVLVPGWKSSWNCFATEVVVPPKQINYDAQPVGWILIPNSDGVSMGRTSKLSQKKKQKTQRRAIPPKTRRGRRQNGGKFNLQKMLEKTGVEFHWRGYQYMGPGTHLAKRRKRGDQGINWLDKIARQRNIDYSNVKNLQDK